MDDGWKLRTGNIVTSVVGAGASVDIVAFGNPGIGVPDDLPAQHIEIVQRKHAYSALRLLQGILGRTPFTVLNYRDAEFRARVLQMCRHRRYDVLIVEDIVMAQYAESVALPRILDMHNIESALLRRYANHERSIFRRAYARLTSRKLQRYEAHVAPSFSHVMVCSEEDGRLLRGLGLASNISVLPNGVDTNYFRPELNSQLSSRIVFVGSMDYHANITGAEHFVNEVFPLICTAHDKAHLFIVGKNPDDRVARLASDRVIVTGGVPDVRPYLQQASVVIAPLLVGGGTRLKILEAMACGKPVVATSTGCEGLRVRDGHDLLIADTPREFAEAVVALLADREKADRLGEQARRTVKEQYDWRVVSGTMYRCLDALYAAPHPTVA